MRKKYGLFSACVELLFCFSVLLSFLFNTTLFLSLPEFVTVVKWRVLCALGLDGNK